MKNHWWKNVYYTGLECKKAYSNTPIVYLKWPPKWAVEQDFWAKLGTKKCKWEKYKFNQKLPSCMLLRKTIIIILWLSFEIFMIKRCQKLLFFRHFCKHCFSSFSVIPAKCLYVSTISVAKHSIKRIIISRIMFSQMFR